MQLVSRTPAPDLREPPDPDLSDAALAASITTLAANIAATTYQWLHLIAEFDRRKAWAGVGIHSCAHWLNWRCGLDLGAAREKVKVARALEPLPAIAASFASGRITYSNVRAMTRVATPANQAALLNIAHHGTAAHVERAVRAYRRMLRIQDTLRAKQAHVHRELRWRYDDDSSLVLKACLPEARVAIAVASGESLRNFAKRTSTTYESTRFMLKQVYQKMGVHKQHELTGLLHNALPHVAGRAPGSEA